MWGRWVQPSDDHVCDENKIEGGCCSQDRCWGGPAAQVTQNNDAGWSDCQAGRRIPLPVGESELAAGNYDAMPEAVFHLLNELAAQLRPVPESKAEEADRERRPPDPPPVGEFDHPIALRALHQAGTT